MRLQVRWIGGVVALFLATAISAQSNQRTLKAERKYWRKQIQFFQRIDPNNPRIYEAHMKLASIEEGLRNKLNALAEFDRALAFQQRTLAPGDIAIASTLEAEAGFYSRWQEPARFETVSNCIPPGFVISPETDPTVQCRTLTAYVPAEGPNLKRVVLLLGAALVIRERAGGQSKDIVPYLIELCKMQVAAGMTAQAQNTLLRMHKIVGSGGHPSLDAGSGTFTCIVNSM